MIRVKTTHLAASNEAYGLVYVVPLLRDAPLLDRIRGVRGFYVNGKRRLYWVWWDRA